MEQLEAAWQMLYREGEHTLFQSFEFNQLAAKVFADREAACVVFAETENGIAIIPAAIGRERATLQGEELFDYRDVLFAGDGEALLLAWTRLSEVEGLARLPFSVKGVRTASLERGAGFDSTFFAN